MVAATFKAGEPQPVIEVTSRFRTRDRRVELKPGAGMQATAAELATQPEGDRAAADRRHRAEDRARDHQGRANRRATRRARSTSGWWTTPFRNPKTRGCGVGDIKAMLETGNLNGKCADLNALYVGLGGAAGVPARDVYGIRVAARSSATRAWARPATSPGAALPRRVHRARLSAGCRSIRPTCARWSWKRSRNLTLTDEVVKEARTMLWGGWEGTGWATTTPTMCGCRVQPRRPVPFLMYPQAENAQGRLDALDAENFRYRITSKEVGRIASLG